MSTGAKKKSEKSSASKPSSFSAETSFVAIVGSDEAEIKRVAKQYAAKMVPAGAGDMGCETLDGGVENVEQAVTRIHQTVEALLTLPFFGGDKLVWLKNADMMADSVVGRSESVLNALEKLSATIASGFPNGVRFLLSAIDIDKRRAFYKGLSKHAHVEIYDKVDASRSGWEEAAGNQAEQRAQRYGLVLRGEPLELFTLLIGGDSRQMENELEKLDLYLGEGRREVLLEDVRTMVPASRAGVVFELGNAIVSRDLNQALNLIDQLLFQGETVVGILLVAVIPTVRNLLLAKDLMQRHRLSKPAAPFHFTGALNRLPAAATAHLPRKKDGGLNTYSLGIAATGAHRYEVTELQASLEACLEANVALVTSSYDVKTLLVELIVRIIAKGGSGSVDKTRRI